MEALIQSRDQKMVHHLGVTGLFRPEALIEGIRRSLFDIVLMGVNEADNYYGFEKDLITGLSSRPRPAADVDPQASLEVGSTAPHLTLRISAASLSRAS